MKWKTFFRVFEGLSCDEKQKFDKKNSRQALMIIITEALHN